MDEKLRIGLLLESETVPAWCYRMLERMVGSDYCEIELLILRNSRGKAPESQSKPSLFERLVHKALDVFHNRILNRVKPHPDPFAPRSLSELLPDTTRLTVTPIEKVWSDYLNEDDLRSIAEHRLDLLVRLGFRVLRRGILTVTRYGIWSYHHGDNRINRGGPPAYWEVMESWPVTGSVLQILSEDLDNGKILARSWSCTNNQSINWNKYPYYWKTLSLLPRQLQRLHAMGGDRYMSEVNENNSFPELYSRPLYRRATPMHYFRHLSGLVWQRLVEKLTSAFYLDQWVLMYRLEQQPATTFWRFKTLTPPIDRFWADPHILERNGLFHVFIEELPYRTRKGHISHFTIDPKGRATEPVPVLERPYHLSYPFVFEYDNRVFMIPETASNKTVELYECVEFPHGWEFRHNLMTDVHAVDATLFEHNNRWWMFTNKAENPGASSCDELFLYSADSPLASEWVAHPMNPIVSDVRQARPAGAVFRHEGKLIRPSQNCGTRYGYGFNLAEITRLDESNYEEVVRTAATPDWKKELRRTHSYSHVPGLTVIDGQMRRRK